MAPMLSGPYRYCFRPSATAPSFPAIYVGTSIGAVQVAYLAGRAAEPLDGVLAGGQENWRQMGLRQIVSSPFSLQQLGILTRSFAMAIGLPVRPPSSFLAAKPMKRAVEGIADYGQIHAHVQSGKLAAVAVVATSSSTGLSVVFHDGGEPPERDQRRGIDYVSTRLTAEHVRASSAIPSLFPPVHVCKPKDAAGWYVDGGTRLNTPIKPALALGAKRLVIVGLNSTSPNPKSKPKRRPDAIDGVGHLTQGILADPLYHDVQTLARLNRVAREGGGGACLRGDSIHLCHAGASRTDRRGCRRGFFEALPAAAPPRLPAAAPPWAPSERRGERSARRTAELSLLRGGVRGRLGQGGLRRCRRVAEENPRLRPLATPAAP